ncbi:carboxymuconolactone decarboxylase family protein [Streptomyces indicus]|uniref:Alkylhydroperoxidase AhpD family core domain-containing protein n=1 Tax=Streptomyces indicus TaxID=417292 RepID=A0A1G8UNZ6_9ACTN|nr:carboxymuconolactone decarboxylase family protein [Streptomyces indicus]SDJ55491.1 alkylhydroperoxidase AhpD family core domain-containing protein [Streptomyces indicus]
MPGPFRYTNPTPAKAATGRTAAVYAQIGTDFGRDSLPTFQVLSPSYELLSSAWALMRESLLAGEGSRTGKELAALGVSQANRCRFCVDAHTMLLHATGEHRLAERLAADGVPEDEGQARILAWARESRAPEHAALPPVATAEHPAYIGTALSFHFINRIASALLTPDLLPGGAQRYRAVRSLAGRSLAHAVRRTLEPGLSLPLLTHRAAGPAWAAGTEVGGAFAALRNAALMGAGLLEPDERKEVEARVAAWRGEHPPPDWPALPAREERPGVRVALLAALAPYRITDADVAAWRTPQHADHCLVHLIGYGAFLAVDRIATAIDAAAVDAAALTDRHAPPPEPARLTDATDRAADTADDPAQETR